MGCGGSCDYMLGRDASILTVQPFPYMRLLHLAFVSTRLMPCTNLGCQYNLAPDNFDYVF
jgi:hypothetical protein